MPVVRERPVEREPPVARVGARGLVELGRPRGGLAIARGVEVVQKPRDLGYVVVQSRTPRRRSATPPAR